MPAAVNRLPVGRHLEPLRPDLRARLEPEGHEWRPVRLGEVGRQPPPPLTSDIHGRGRRLGGREEPPLRLEVLVHRPVQVEVILAEVREHERAEADAVETPERGAVRRRLDRRAAIPCVEHLAEEALEVDRLRRREGRRAMLAADDPLDRPHEPRPSTGRLEHRVEQEHDRRLPIRPCDARDLELLRRLAEERVRSDGHRGPRVRHHELRHVASELHRVLDDERARTPLDGGTRERVSVDATPGNAEEERPRSERSACRTRGPRSRPGVLRSPRSGRGRGSAPRAPRAER